jgi:hypothetical protein
MRDILAINERDINDNSEGKEETGKTASLIFGWR